MRVVDVELHGVKEVGDLALLHRSPVDEVLVLASYHDLSRDGHLVKIIVTHGADATLSRASGSVGDERSHVGPR